MAFPPKLLNEDETVVLDLRPHWWFLTGPVVSLALLSVLAVFVRNVEYAGVAALALVAIAIVVAVVRYLRWITTNFVLTTDRLIYRSGVLAKRGIEIPLERVNDITFSQSIRERLVGAGDLMIQSGGERGQQHFSNIAKPSIVQNIIHREMEAAAARDALRTSGGARELSIPEQIEKLDELRQRGVLSQAEFDAKKTQLLDRM